MDAIFNGAVQGAIFGGVAGAIAVLVLAFFRRPTKCPDCGEPFPKFRKPANRQEALWGGNTCSKCGCKVDRRGKKIT